MKDSKLIVFDSTLREGEQAPGNSMLPKEKLTIAKLLEQTNIDVIEAGFAAASPSEAESISTISKSLKKSKVCSLTRALPVDIDITLEALKGGYDPRIHVFLATSDLHMTYKLKKKPVEVLSQIKEAISYIRTTNADIDIQFSAEDASRSNPKFLARAFETAIKAGANTVNISDTVGYLVPEETKNLISFLRTHVSGLNKTTLSIHCHNDLGLALANSLTAINNGINQIEVTINGIGERAGNCSLKALITLHAQGKLTTGLQEINGVNLDKAIQQLTSTIAFSTK